MARTPPIEALTTVRLNYRLIAMMRLVLASTVLFVIVPSDVDDLGPFHLLAVLFMVYSALLYILICSNRFSHRALSRLSFWGDLVWVVLLNAFSEDPSVAFLFLLPTLVASFQWEFAEALRLIVVAATLLALIRFEVPHEDRLTLAQIFLPPIYLLVFGYLMASWGDREITARRRLLLMKETTMLSNPRFGIDRMLGLMMERLRAFYDAGTCLLITTHPFHNSFLLRRCDGQRAEGASHAEPVPEETARVLLAPDPAHALIYHSAPQGWRRWWSPEPRYDVVDLHKDGIARPAAAPDSALIALLDADAFVSVPMNYPDTMIGRLYLTAESKRAFTPADVGFLIQVIEQAMPVIENIRLVDQLASNAAEEERQRLARDIHDNVIQSYVGFQIGLAAVSNKINHGGNVADDIARLMTVADREIGGLRNYIKQLRVANGHEDILSAAIRRYSAAFSEATRIAMQVEVAPEVQIHDRLAAELFQLIVEGLSNIRRHSEATQVQIALRCERDHLIVQIANNDASGIVPAPFFPRSISERAAALGGQIFVERQSGGGAQVIVDIPL